MNISLSAIAHVRGAGDIQPWTTKVNARGARALYLGGLTVILHDVEAARALHSAAAATLRQMEGLDIPEAPMAPAVLGEAA